VRWSALRYRTTISPECYTSGECAAACADTCVTILTMTCADLCALGDDAAQPPDTCAPIEEGYTRLAPNQKGRCYGNMEICKSGTWKIADGSWEWQDETCNGLDDDCNGVVDDMFVTCGDPGPLPEHSEHLQSGQPDGAGPVRHAAAALAG